MSTAITSAPDTYDYSWTIEVIPFGIVTYQGRPVRWVRFTDDADRDHQLGGYASGSHLAIAYEDLCESDIGTDQAAAERLAD